MVKRLTAIATTVCLSAGLFAGAVAGVVAGTTAMSIATASPVFAADGEARSKSGWPKPSRSVKAGEKLCRYKFSDNEHTVWVCQKAEPCCEWEALNKYVKCGSTITGCL